MAFSSVTDKQLPNLQPFKGASNTETISIAVGTTVGVLVIAALIAAVIVVAKKKLAE